ncbi:hypothetical protein GGR57DRAFT_508502 [Xylariaceae sp. FL1272]|nr:hypothetical protein GGR57DRAFT_508502 [Xylariaceae sp. FL1272]
MSPQPSHDISNQDILRSLWDVGAGGEENGVRGVNLSDEYCLDAYLHYCQKQFKRLNHTVSPRHVLPIIEQLRGSISISRQEAKAKLSDSHRDDDNSPLSKDNTVQDDRFDEDVTENALDVAASIILAVYITHNTNSIEPGRSKIQWHESETIEALIKKAFPITTASTEEPFTTVKPSKLRALYFESHANIKIQWTEHLYDHLQLSTSDESKTLKVFQLPCMLEAALGVLRNTKPDENDQNESVSVHYSEGFLLETLMTIQLLFPTQDKKRLRDRTSNTRKWFPSWLRSKSSFENLDAHLFSPFVPEGQYQRPLTNRRELYERYPHWGLRLHMLLEEVDDPTPLSWVGRWSERRKSARHSFWVTFVAFVIAIVFGLVATVLGGIQVWISYCQWQGEAGGGSACRVRTSDSTANMNNLTI